MYLNKRTHADARYGVFCLLNPCGLISLAFKLVETLVAKVHWIISRRLTTILEMNSLAKMSRNRRWQCGKDDHKGFAKARCSTIAVVACSDFYMGLQQWYFCPSLGR